MKQVRLGIAAVVALGAAGFATGAATAPITVDLLVRHADSSVVQVQYDHYYNPYSDPSWRAERLRNRDAWRAERLRNRDAWRAERFHERDAWRAERWRERNAWRAWREERSWNGW
ncbi:hypothetical protein FG93_04973 [Bosea sp. LC85]|uniref:hypothetical protein n=1 Tax=Bosea sp. LC85 TaxID=1502851 RepID=UPI0004E2EA11|nr:hypothetical protein [Bosea sp. LC85]KFC64951.1 hypothetical protein FG93_04973 [Bosea sp. LC85]